MSLAHVRSGQKVRIVGIHAGREFSAHMEALGLLPGVELEVLCNNGCGGFMIKLNGSRIALGRGMARKILVA